MKSPSYISNKIAAFLLAVIISSLAFGQQEGAVFFFDGEDVVFEFDLEAWRNAEICCFDDLEIEEVEVSGSSAQIIRKGWLMQRISEGRFQLRKALEDFTDEFDLSWKYLINGKHWVTPQWKDDAEAQQWEPPAAYQIMGISDTGNVDFFLSGFPQASNVILAGSFNNWDEHAYRMVRKGNGWFLRLQLPPDRYEYKFIVDGKWMHDFENPQKTPNEHFTFNSVLYIGKKVEFTLTGHRSARNVYVAGNFNNWNPRSMALVKGPHDWHLELNLPPGKHLYKFIVDGKWIVDPQNILIEKDPKGNSNSVLLVN